MAKRDPVSDAANRFPPNAWKPSPKPASACRAAKTSAATSNGRSSKKASGNREPEKELRKHPCDENATEDREERAGG